MVIDDYLQQAREESELSIHPGWGQGRTTFGGLSAALLVEKQQQEQSGGRYLRSLNINFCGPLFTEQAFKLETQTLSSGKSISQINGQAIQNDKVATQLVACFGIERESDINVIPTIRDLGPAGAGSRLNYIKGITPEFVQHVEFSYTLGKFPFSNTKETKLGGWVRFKESPAVMSEAHLIALIDAWPPTLLPMLKTSCPCATVSWNLEFIQPLPNLEPGDWIYYEAEIKQAHHGYGHTDAKIYNQNGQLLALSRQLTSVYDKR